MPHILPVRLQQICSRTQNRIDLKEFVKMQQHGKYYITLKGVRYEVSQEVHDAYYQAERQERYMAEKDQSHNLVILDILGMEELEGERNQEHLASPQHGMESQLIKKEMVEYLHQCLQMLPKAERDLI